MLGWGARLGFQFLPWGLLGPPHIMAAGFQERVFPETQASSIRHFATQLQETQNITSATFCELSKSPRRTWSQRKDREISASVSGRRIKAPAATFAAELLACPEVQVSHSCGNEGHQVGTHRNSFSSGSGGQKSKISITGPKSRPPSCAPSRGPGENLSLRLPASGGC